VSAVLFDDVKDMLDRKLESRARTKTRRAGIYLLRPSGGVSIDVFLIDDRKRATQECENVITGAALGVGLRAVWTRTTGTNPLGAEHKELIAMRQKFCWIPTGRNKSNCLARRLIKHGNSVHAGQRYIESIAIYRAGS